MWKFHDFSITQILCEINFVDSAFLTHLRRLEALNFHFYEFLHFLKAKMNKLAKFKVPRLANMAVLKLLDSSKLNSSKSENI